MNTTADRIAHALALAAKADSPRQARWFRDHAAYLRALDANRETYRLLADESGLSMADFNALTRAEIDEDRAGDDSGEWVRAARVVVDRIVDARVAAERARVETPEFYYADGEWNEAEAYRRAVWSRACDAQLDYRA
jgi:hypothetical protein